MDKMINKLKKKGYRYAFMLSTNNKVFYAIKSEMVNGDFTDDTDVDVYKLRDSESWEGPIGKIIKL